jgi:hypothetical protein
MADLLLSGVLDFQGVVDLVGDAGGHVKANGVEVSTYGSSRRSTRR